MINKRVLVLVFDLLILLVVIRVSAHAVGYSVDVFDGTTPVIDGEMAPGEWNDASTLSFNFTIVHLKHDANNLYIAFNISDATLDSDFEGVYLGLDTSNDGGPSLNQSDDIMIGTYRNGTAFETDGMGPLPPSPGWNVSVFEEAAGYTIEFNVTYGRIGITSGENKTLGLLLLSFDQSAFQYSIWPIMGSMDGMIPSNWGDMMVVFQTGPIYIKPDGSIEGTDKIVSMDNITYTFTSDINAPIVVQRSNIVIDGEGWTLDGIDFTIMEGFNLTAVTNVTITDVNIERFASYSIYLKSASQCVISRNTVSGSEGGIGLFSSTGNTVSNNVITGCSEAVELVSSSGNTVSGNNITNNNSGVYLVLSSTDNTVVGNNMTFNNNLGVLVSSSSNFNTIGGNNIITHQNEGIRLEYSSNNSISENKMVSNGYAMWLMHSSQNIISNNNATHNEGGIWLTSSSAGNTVSQNKVTESVEAVALDSFSYGNTISNNTLAESHYGVYVRNVSGNLISGNNITANTHSGVYILNASDNAILKNDITNNWNGIDVAASSNNTLSGNNVTGNIVGIRAGSALINSVLVKSTNNAVLGNTIVNNTNGVDVIGVLFTTISRNHIAENSQYGISLDAASNNTISANNIADNNLGVYYDGLCNNNTAYHNNFIGNTKHVEVSPSDVDAWDDGVEGNYWSNYTGVDLNHDGLGDSPHVLDVNNTDNAPLMGPFHSFNTSLGKPVNVISNSTIEDFEYESPGTIRFSVSNMTENQTHGFCRVTIPHDVLSPPYNVTINGLSPTHMNYTLYDNGTHSWIYFEYEHSTSEVIIIPEFPFYEILPLIMIMMSLATLAYRRKHISEA